MTATWITGDTLTVLRAMPTASVDLVVTSPPFLALRSYLPDDDPAKADEIGQEATPGEFLDVLLDITEELRRVLAPHGSICVELGDTYAGSSQSSGDRSAEDADGATKYRRGPRPISEPERSGDGWPTDKSLCLIPELYRFSLAYGLNPLTGRTTPRWRIRNVIRWVRPNPPVGALGDKFRPGTSEMVIATGIDEAGRTRYFDLDAVRTPTLATPETRGVGQASASKGISGGDSASPDKERLTHNPAGAPPLDWWEIPTAPYKGSHYATYPPALVERPVKAMSPQRVCTTCGEPSRRIAETTNAVGHRPISDGAAKGRRGESDNGVRPDMNAGPDRTERVTVGWTDCGHDTWRPGIVLDPFGGSGTTLAVATGHGRDAIGIDLDTRNADLARERIGPMFFEHRTVDELWPEDGAA